MDKVCVAAVAQCDAGNRSARLRALLDDLDFEGLGVGTTLWLHEILCLKARSGVHLNQVHTIAFGFGVRKMCWSDGYG